METVAAEKIPVATGTTASAGDSNESTEAVVEQTLPVESAPADGATSEGEKPKTENKSAKVVFAHIALMEANGLKPEKLPTDLKMRINAWMMGVRKHDKNPTPKLMEMNKKGSVAIADAIQNWIEKDLPEKSEEQVLAENKAKEEKAMQEKENRERMMRIKNQREESEREQRSELERKERELKTQRDAQEKIAMAKKSKENKVAGILKEKGKIRYKELIEILGHDVGESVQVGSIKLLNVYLTNNYKQIK